MKVNNVMPVAEVGKYLKKKDSDISNAKKKAKHKHTYSDCLLINVGKDYLPNHNVFLGSYCTICGKVSNWNIVWETEYRGLYQAFSSITDEEVMRRYSHLPRFEVENIYKTERVEV